MNYTLLYIRDISEAASTIPCRETLRGKKIFITHGDLYGVKYGMTNIYYKGKEVGADIVLFGHSQFFVGKLSL